MNDGAQLHIHTNTVFQIWLKYPVPRLLFDSRLDLRCWSAFRNHGSYGSVLGNLKHQLNRVRALGLFVDKDPIHTANDAARPDVSYSFSWCKTDVPPNVLLGARIPTSPSPATADSDTSHRSCATSYKVPIRLFGLPVPCEPGERRSVHRSGV